MNSHRKSGYQDGLLCALSMARTYSKEPLKHEDFPFDSLYKKIFARKILNKYEEEYNNGIKKGIEIITREIKIGGK